MLCLLTPLMSKVKKNRVINAGDFEKRLAANQANYLAANFTVLSSIESSKPLGTGFDAVVWQGKAETPYAGQVCVCAESFVNHALTTGFWR